MKHTHILSGERVLVVERRCTGEMLLTELRYGKNAADERFQHTHRVCERCGDSAVEIDDVVVVDSTQEILALTREMMTGYRYFFPETEEEIEGIKRDEINSHLLEDLETRLRSGGHRVKLA